VYAIDFLFLV